MRPCLGASRLHDIRAASRRRISNVTSVMLREGVALMRHPVTTSSAVEWRRHGGALAGESRESEAVTGCSAEVFHQTCVGRPERILLSTAPYHKMTRAVSRPAPSRTVALSGGGSAVSKFATSSYPSTCLHRCTLPQCAAVCRGVNEAADGAKVVAHSTDALSLLPDTAEACCCLATKGCHHVLPASIRT